MSAQKMRLYVVDLVLAPGSEGEKNNGKKGGVDADYVCLRIFIVLFAYLHDLRIDTAD